MKVVLELEPDVEMTAAKQAQAEGLSLVRYVEILLKEAVLKRQRVEQLSEKPFDEMLKPFRDEVEASGVSEDELADLFRQARQEATRARRNQ